MHRCSSAKILDSEEGGGGKPFEIIAIKIAAKRSNELLEPLSLISEDLMTCIIRAEFLIVFCTCILTKFCVKFFTYLGYGIHIFSL